LTKKKIIEILFNGEKYRVERFVFLIIFWLFVLYLSTEFQISLPVILVPVLILALIMSVIKITWYNKKYNIPRKALDWVELVLCSIVLVVVFFLVFQGDKLDNEKSFPLYMVVSTLEKKKIDFKEINNNDKNLFQKELVSIQPKVFKLEKGTLSIYVFPTSEELVKGKEAFEQGTATVSLEPYEEFTINNVLIFYVEGSAEISEVIQNTVQRLVE
jgi:hypothetical protein